MSAVDGLNNGRDYFDIDDILASEERVAVIFNFTIPNIGKYIKTAAAMQKEHLRQITNGNQDHSEDEIEEENNNSIKFIEKYIIERGTKVEVPFWLASVCGKEGFVEVEVPRVFTDLNYVTSNFEKASLSKVNRYFYDFGTSLFKLMAEIAESIKQDQELESLYIRKRYTLIDTLVHRFKVFLRQGYIASNQKSTSSWLTEQYSEFKSKLCNSELTILQMIQLEETSFIDWKHKSLGTYKLQYGDKNYISESSNNDNTSTTEDDSDPGNKRRRM
ncbi:hypothetical protein NAEGRDRAFT_62119 [Naegleria gruberi]|uniref:GINS subunit domain-containing protein n=1 Tax=Naegleria gruberi TaxID=5762 RepID=D2UZZ9_NAEGR|nr:uncharacterized protein NAEGRDRAFT_62119 [Naegleria gruberi]EFC50252.1 hypothetical protein NAEGRDRAFT_62119 [Naegleria gruberi]|eukprot:XP_002682996.1 hypothetical protein NAEGRDRAFT_62119 [Naegleria gruberi strain NEG-M]